MGWNRFEIQWPDCPCRPPFRYAPTPAGHEPECRRGDISMIAFGPVPSRRLGRSLGINNIPPKACSYSCIYCQVGQTLRKEVERRTFYQPDELYGDVSEKVEKVRRIREPIDYLTFVSDGEPTLDINLGQEIDLLLQLGVKIAVITNGSLLWHEDVRNELMKADWVSVKVDSVIWRPWSRVNRPHRTLQLERILDGIREFAHAFPGTLVTETMLVSGVNDSIADLEAVSGFLACLDPDISYLSVPTRPPAEKNVRSPGEKVVNRSYHQLCGHLSRVELLIGYEGNAFANSGDVEEDLLSITAVHPMRRDAVEAFLKQANAEWTIVDSLIARGRLVSTGYGGAKFYLRKL